MMGKESEQIVHSVEEVGWPHHIWDEIGGELVTGSLMVVGLVVAAVAAVWAKRRWGKHE